MTAQILPPGVCPEGLTVVGARGAYVTTPIELRLLTLPGPDQPEARALLAFTR